jgi:hypothetical protein
MGLALATATLPDVSCTPDATVNLDNVARNGLPDLEWALLRSLCLIVCTRTDTRSYVSRMIVLMCAGTPLYDVTTQFFVKLKDLHQSSVKLAVIAFRNF